jgi:hypothetical protein
MKLLTLAAACAAVFTLTAAPAFAFAEGSVVAKLAQPVAQSTKFIAGDAVFLCEGDTCMAAAPVSGTFATSTCKVIASKLGTVVSFSGVKTMDDARLGACNTVAVARAAGGAQLAKH